MAAKKKRTNGGEKKLKKKFLQKISFLVQRQPCPRLIPTLIVSLTSADADVDADADADADVDVDGSQLGIERDVKNLI